MTHKQRVLELLSDYEPHDHMEGYRLGVMLHSRIADLRRDGYLIESWRTGDLYFYQLHGRLAAAAAASNPQPTDGDHEERTTASRVGDGTAVAAASPQVFGAGTHQPSRGERESDASGPEQLRLVAA